MSELRPIGTEFWYEFPFNPRSVEGGNKQHRFLYQVKSHDRVARFPGDEVGELAEHVEPIKSEFRNLISISQCSECSGVKYKFDEWREAKDEQS